MVWSENREEEPRRNQPRRSRKYSATKTPLREMSSNVKSQPISIRGRRKSPSRKTSPQRDSEEHSSNLYKTELCRSFAETGTCRYNTKCQFAHGREELRVLTRHPKYKTEVCRSFWSVGTCPYGTRCRFIHTQRPAGVTGSPPSPGEIIERPPGLHSPQLQSPPTPVPTGSPPPPYVPTQTFGSLPFGSPPTYRVSSASVMSAIADPPAEAALGSSPPSGSPPRKRLAFFTDLAPPTPPGNTVDFQF